MAAARTFPLPLWSDALLLVASKLVVGGWLLSTGFRAISDDDYSRVVIAQGFAEAPQLDPSGTSWLPFPFWVHGLAHAAFGPALEVARATALTLGAAAVLLCWLAARALGAPRAGALLGALIAAIFPYSAWLGVAMVPEALTAGLVVFGAATLAKAAPGLRLAGALALLCACLSRYEAWPAALSFALFDALDARRVRALWAPAVLALAGPLLWLAHGVVVHGDAWFFVGRVTAYRAALGGVEASALVRLLWYPLALLRCEPELAACAAVALLSARLLRLGPELGAYRRFFACLAAVLLFLIAGSLRGGAPTHHAERALLAFWLGLSLFSGDALLRAWTRFGARARLTLVVALALELGGGLALRPYVAKREPFSARDPELDMGREARLLGVPRLAIVTDDYGYFAMMASFESPALAAPLLSRDPRRAREADPLSEPELLRHTLAERGASFLVAPRRYEPLLRGLGRIAAKNELFVLMEARH